MNPDFRLRFGVLVVWGLLCLPAIWLLWSRPVETYGWGAALPGDLWPLEHVLWWRSILRACTALLVALVALACHCAGIRSGWEFRCAWAALCVSGVAVSALWTNPPDWQDRFNFYRFVSVEVCWVWIWVQLAKKA